jgi:hypothetical protein
MNLYTVLKYDSITKSIVLAEVKNAQVLNLSSRSMEDVQWNAWRFIHVKKVSPSKSKPLKTKALQLDVFENENVLIRAVIL